MPVPDPDPDPMPDDEGTQQLADLVETHSFQSLSLTSWSAGVKPLGGEEEEEETEVLSNSWYSERRTSPTLASRSVPKSNGNWVLVVALEGSNDNKAPAGCDGYMSAINTQRWSSSVAEDDATNPVQAWTRSRARRERSIVSSLGTRMLTPGQPPVLLLASYNADTDKQVLGAGDTRVGAKTSSLGAWTRSSCNTRGYAMVDVDVDVDNTQAAASAAAGATSIKRHTNKCNMRIDAGMSSTITSDASTFSKTGLDQSTTDERSGSTTSTRS